jgi:hypothetical protein
LGFARLTEPVSAVRAGLYRFCGSGFMPRQFVGASRGIKPLPQRACWRVKDKSRPRLGAGGRLRAQVKTMSCRLLLVTCHLLGTCAPSFAISPSIDFVRTALLSTALNFLASAKYSRAAVVSPCW